MAGLISSVALAMVWVCLTISKDTRKRRAVAQQLQGLPRDTLEHHFKVCMWEAGLYLAKPFCPAVPWQRAENALLIATVLREQLEYRSGRKAYVGHLRSRGEFAAEAKRFAAPHLPSVLRAVRA